MKLARALLLTFLLVTTSCVHAPPSVTTPAGKAAYNADQLANAIGSVLKAAIDANGKGLLDDPTTRLIVDWSENAEKILQATPAGWQTVLKTSWQTLKNQIPVTNPAISAAVSAADVLLAALGS